LIQHAITITIVFCLKTAGKDRKKSHHSSSSAYASSVVAPPLPPPRAPAVEFSLEDEEVYVERLRNKR
jgi:hypothetical protein